MGQGPSDIKIYTADSLEQAEKCRKLLMAHNPRPCVYVYPVKVDGEVLEYDISVATQWGSSPDENFVVQLKCYLNNSLFSDKAEKN